MKKILAIAIAAGISAPVLADTTVYGQLHASLDFLSADGEKDLTTVSSNSSRIGVKGSSELNSGLKAIYQAEWGIDTGGAASGKDSVFSNRNQVVGLAGGFGAVLVGRHDTPMKTVARKADLGWSTQVGTNYTMTNPGLWDMRANNVIAYQTPKMGGFQALGAYVTDLGGTSDSNAVSLNGFYNAGPLTLGAGYETHDLDGEDDENAYRLMGSYKIGAAKLVAFYQDEENGSRTSGGVKTDLADATVWGVGAAYGMGAGTVKGQYYERDVDGASDAQDLFMIGYDHKLGSKTDIYAQYVTASEGAAVGTVGRTNGIQSSTGGDADGISFGIRQKF